MKRGFKLGALAVAAIAFSAILSSPKLGRWVDLGGQNRVWRQQPKSGIVLEQEKCSRAVVLAKALKDCESDADCTIINLSPYGCGCESINTKHIGAYQSALKENCKQPFACFAMVDPACHSQPVCQRGVCGPQSGLR